MAKARAPGQVGYSLAAAVVGVAVALVGVTVAASPIQAGLAVGGGVALAVAELTRLARLSAVVGVVVGVVAGGIAAGVVVAFADGTITLSLPAVVAGAGVALMVVGAARYAEHVIAVEGPAGAGAAMAARLWLPWRDLFLALGGHPLQQQRALAPKPASSPAARLR